MEEEATKTEYLTSVEAEETREKMLKAIKQPIPLQRFRFTHDHTLPKHYDATVVVDKVDRISIIKKAYELKIGTNGLFIKERSTMKSGITYHKKGRSSARLRYWSGYNHKRERYDLLKQFAKIINPDTAHVFDSDIVKDIGTQGMHGYIMAGNITNNTEAMQYYIRYSLRGVGIKQENADNLYTYLAGADRGYLSASMVLRAMEDPNAVLERFATPSTDTSFLMQAINTNGDRLSRAALSVGEKVNWLTPGFSPGDEQERIDKVINKFHSYLNIWDDGPILWSNNKSKKNVDQYESNVPSFDL